MNEMKSRLYCEKWITLQSTQLETYVGVNLKIAGSNCVLVKYLLHINSYSSHASQNLNARWTLTQNNFREYWILDIEQKSSW